MLHTAQQETAHFIPHEDMLDFSDFLHEQADKPWLDLTQEQKLELISEFLRDETNSDPQIQQQGEGIVELQCLYLGKQKSITLDLNQSSGEIARLLQSLFF